MRADQYILHIDGDGFFAGCEMAVNVSLRGKKVVVGRERGIATAVSYEAKKCGILRGMPIHHVQKMFPDAIIVSGNYRLYMEFSRRMRSIVGRSSSQVEAYSIDECFAYVTGNSNQSLYSLGRKIQEVLMSELGVSFSVGIGKTKVRAKIASKFQKPFGCTVFERDVCDSSRAVIPVGSVWGIGKSTAQFLQAQGIVTLADFMHTKESVIMNIGDKHVREIWSELAGIPVFSIITHESIPQSISSTRTFSKRTSSLSTLMQELALHTETVAFRLRSFQAVCGSFSFFIKTHQSEYHTQKITFDIPTNATHEIVRHIRPLLKNMYQSQGLYRSAGVTALSITPVHFQGLSLFEADTTHKRLYATVDTILKKYGSDSIMLASGYRPHEKEHIVGVEVHGSFPLPFIGYVD